MVIAGISTAYSTAYNQQLQNAYGSGTGTPAPNAAGTTSASQPGSAQQSSSVPRHHHHDPDGNAAASQVYDGPQSGTDSETVTNILDKLV